jgi:hypothetical protein
MIANFLSIKEELKSSQAVPSESSTVEQRIDRLFKRASSCSINCSDLPIGELR